MIWQPAPSIDTADWHCKPLRRPNFASRSSPTVRRNESRSRIASKPNVPSYHFSGIGIRTALSWPNSDLVREESRHPDPTSSDLMALPANTKKQGTRVWRRISDSALRSSTDTHRLLRADGTLRRASRGPRIQSPNQTTSIPRCSCPVETWDTPDLRDR